MKRRQQIEDLAAFRGISCEEAEQQLFRDMLVDETEDKMLGKEHCEVAAVPPPDFEVSMWEEKQQRLIEETEHKMTDMSPSMQERLNAAAGVMAGTKPQTIFMAPDDWADILKDTVFVKKDRQGREG